MAYCENWLNHLAAPLTGEGLSKRLASDFWPSEDLWNSNMAITRRWLKLIWVYSASVVAQLTLSSLIAVALIDLLYRDVPYIWWLITIGGGTTIMLLLAVIIATATYVSVVRKTQLKGPRSN